MIHGDENRHRDRLALLTQEIRGVELRVEPRGFDNTAPISRTAVSNVGSLASSPMKRRGGRVAQCNVVGGALVTACRIQSLPCS